MLAKLIKIGNSQGVRLPKAVLEQVGLQGDLELEVIEGAVVIRPLRRVREGWADAAERCRRAGEDVLEEWDVAAADFSGSWE